MLVSHSNHTKPLNTWTILYHICYEGKILCYIGRVVRIQWNSSSLKLYSTDGIITKWSMRYRDALAVSSLGLPISLTKET